MKLLVLNIGSTSFRFSIFDMEQLNLLASGKLENLGSQDSYCIYEKSSKKIKFKYNIKNVHEAIDLMNKLLLNNSVGIINSITAFEIPSFHNNYQKWHQRLFKRI